MSHVIYQFEEIGLDLALPPLAARRALMSAGVSMPQTTWAVLPIEARQGIVQEGSNESVEPTRVQALVSSVLRNVRLMGPVKDPPRERVPDKVIAALAGIRPISHDEWQRLRAIDRYAINVLSGNSRLLWRALTEMAAVKVLGPSSTLQTWVGWLARCEMRVTSQALGELASGRIQDGKAIVVARAVGLRAARSATEWLDGYADKVTGPIELDAHVDQSSGAVLWQAHVSTTEGDFFSAAALIAATSAAIALRDVVSAWDPSSSIVEASLREEAWRVGSGTFGEEATMVTFDPRKVMATLEKRRAEKDAAVAPPVIAPRVVADTPKKKTGAPMWMLVAMFLITLLSLASAVAALLLKKP